MQKILPSFRVYEILWTKGLGGCTPADIFLPATLVFRQGEPKAWYFTSTKNGMILRKNSVNVDVPKFLDYLQSKEPTQYDPVVYTAYLRPSLDGSPAFEVHYLTMDQATSFMTGISKTSFEGIVQEVIPSALDRHTMLRVKWTPPLTSIEQRVSKNPYSSRRIPPDARMATFFGPTEMFNTVIPSGNTFLTRVNALAKEVAEHIGNVLGVSSMSKNPEAFEHLTSSTVFPKIDAPYDPYTQTVTGSTGNFGVASKVDYDSGMASVVMYLQMTEDGRVAFLMGTDIRVNEGYGESDLEGSSRSGKLAISNLNQTTRGKSETRRQGQTQTQGQRQNQYESNEKTLLDSQMYAAWEQLTRTAFLSMQRKGMQMDKPMTLYPAIPPYPYTSVYIKTIGSGWVAPKPPRFDPKLALTNLDDLIPKRPRASSTGGKHGEKEQVNAETNRSILLNRRSQKEIQLVTMADLEFMAHGIDKKGYR